MRKANKGYLDNTHKRESQRNSPTVKLLLHFLFFLRKRCNEEPIKRSLTKGLKGIWKTTSRNGSEVSSNSPRQPDSASFRDKPDLLPTPHFHSLIPSIVQFFFSSQSVNHVLTSVLVPLAAPINVVISAISPPEKTINSFLN